MGPAALPLPGAAGPRDPCCDGLCTWLSGASAFLESTFPWRCSHTRGEHSSSFPRGCAPVLAILLLALRSF